MKLFPALIALLAALYSILYLKPSAITVVADGELNLYDQATLNPVERQVIATLKASKEATVKSCADLKHYLVPEVILADGREAYVIDGPFHLRRERVWPFFDSKPVVWGC